VKFINLCFFPTPKGGLNIYNQIGYINCAWKHKEKNKMEDKNYGEQRMGEEKVFNKAYLPKSGLEAELNQDTLEGENGR
jgi:hypothetical protein